MGIIFEGVRVRVEDLRRQAAFVRRLAVSLPEIAAKPQLGYKTDPGKTRKDRARCGASYIGNLPELGIVRFRTRCPGVDPQGQAHQTWEQRVCFFLWLDDREEDPKLKEVPWTSYIGKNKERLRKSDVLADCNCPDFKFQGGYAISDAEGWGFTDGPSAAYAWPGKRNPSGTGGACKHLLSVAWGFL